MPWIDLMINTFYMPLTATPFNSRETYREILPRFTDLRQYIRCFWGSEKPYLNREGCTDDSIVIPDTCVDIIYTVDHTANTVSGGFCGINDAAFSARYDGVTGHMVSTFAIRFYAWGAYAFSDDSLKGTVNVFCDVASRFCWLDRFLRRQLFERNTLTDRAGAVEEMFLKRMSCVRQNQVVDNAVREMVSNRGVLKTGELAKECFVSDRQLERLFHEYIGMTPKKLGNLVRYQFLWSDILRHSDFNVLDAVYKYGYTDQPHLMREFKRYHTMDIQTAKWYAHNVGNIQDIFYK